MLFLFFYYFFRKNICSGNRFQTSLTYVTQFQVFSESEMRHGLLAVSIRPLTVESQCDLSTNSLLLDSEANAFWTGIARNNNPGCSSPYFVDCDVFVEALKQFLISSASFIKMDESLRQEIMLYLGILSSLCKIVKFGSHLIDFFFFRSLGLWSSYCFQVHAFCQFFSTF